MIHLVVIEEADSKGSMQLVVSHGLDAFGRNVILPTEHPKDIGAVFKPELGGWILYQEGELAAVPPRATKASPMDTTKTCSQCQSPMRRRQGRNGPFWGCSGYPACKHTQPVRNGE